MVSSVTNTISNAYASFTVPVSTGSGYSIHFIHPVKIINPANNKSVSVNLMVDTGGEITRISYSRVASLGINLTSGRRGTMTTVYKGQIPTYRHNLAIQIGTLKPITIPVSLHTAKGDITDTLGWTGVLDKLSLTLSGRKLTYTEVATTALAMAFFSSSSNNHYRSSRL